jgi:hypothetical protein
MPDVHLAMRFVLFRENTVFKMCTLIAAATLARFWLSCFVVTVAEATKCVLNFSK